MTDHNKICKYFEINMLLVIIIFHKKNQKLNIR